MPPCRLNTLRIAARFQEHADLRAARAVMADADDLRVVVEFFAAGGNIAHRDGDTMLAIYAVWSSHGSRTSSSTGAGRDVIGEPFGQSGCGQILHGIPVKVVSDGEPRGPPVLPHERAACNIWTAQRH